MSESKWVEIREAFARVEEAAATDRPALLGELRPEVRAEVESLLAAHEKEAGWLAPLAPEMPQAGSQIGAYRLLELLGKGGMGVVFRAERNDGEFLRQVAIKFCHGVSFGPDAERRLMRERQLLAQLEHPNIVRLLDGGVFRHQRYFVMELVRGISITDRARDLPMEERLRLFISVCGAIQHAHQQMILHRDLKPRNILVSAEGAVKVLDFGIARLLEAEERHTETRTNHLSLSCASPEQLRGEPLTLASDIYSLGVLLYELATGMNPQHREGDTFHQTYDRVTRELPKPPSGICRGLRKDFDSILRKALAKEPAERYPSAAEFAADIERYLEGRPVLALPPSVAYAWMRFIRRNRALSAALSMVILLAALGASLYVAQARREARRFEGARRLVRSVVFDIQPKLSAIPATLPLQKQLVAETVKYLEELVPDASGDASLLAEIAGAYVQLARTAGDSNYSNLGDLAGATRSYEQARRIADQALSIRGRDPDILRRAAEVYLRYGSFALPPKKLELIVRGRDLASTALAQRPSDKALLETYALGLFHHANANSAANWQVALEDFRKAGDVYRKLADDVDTDRNVGLTERYKGSIYYTQKQTAQARPHMQRALEISERRFAQWPKDENVILDLTIDLGQMGVLEMMENQPLQALPNFERRLEIRKAMLARDPDNARFKERLALARKEIAALYSSLGRSEEALSEAGEAVRLYMELMNKHQFRVLTNIADAHHTLAILQTKIGRWKEACKNAATAKAIAESGLKGNTPTAIQLENFEATKQLIRSCASHSP